MDATELINPEILKRFRDFAANTATPGWKDEAVRAMFPMVLYPKPSPEVQEMAVALWWWDTFGKHL